jgi:putative peptidoglycan lipid II flippase
MRRSAWLGALAAGNIGISFAFNWYLIAVLGPGRETDALFAGMIAPQVLLTVGSTALSNVLVPMLAVQRAEELSGMAWSLFQAALWWTGLIAAVLALTAPVWTPLTVPGFPADARPLLVRLACVQLAGAVLTVAGAVQRSAYNARHRFIWPETSTLLSSGVGLLCLVVALPRYGVVAGAWATVARGLAQIVLLLPGMGPYRRPFTASREVRLAWTRLRPLLLGALYFKSDFVVDRFLASLAPAGALSLFSLAQQAYSAAQLILGKALAAPAVPLLAQAAESRHWLRFRRISRHQLLVLMAFAGLGYLGIVLVGRPLLTLTFGHGRFTPERIEELWWLMVLLGGVWCGSVGGQIISSSYYAQGDTRTPILIGSVAFTIAIALKVGGFYAFGISGLAVAATLYYLGSAGAQWLVLERRLQRQLAATQGKADA